MTYDGRKIIFFCVIFLMVFVFSVYSESPPERKFELKLSGGISHLSRTDSEDTADYWSHLSKISTEAAGGAFTREKNNLDWGWEFSGEIVLNLSSRFALSGGAGYITGKYSSTSGTTNQEGAASSTSENDQTVRAVPVTFGICTYLPVSSKSRFYISAGVGYYFASFSFSNYREDDIPYWIDINFTGSGGDIGVHGGIGFEYALSKNIAIVIEGFGRYAKISGFKGTRDREDSNNWSDSSDATHYHYEHYAWTEEWLARTGFSTEPPSGEDVRNVRDFEIDFSGYTIRVGLKIKLF